MYKNKICFVLIAMCCLGPLALGKQAPRRIQGGGSFAATDSTQVDFSETMIDGKMQAPQGFFLQGKKGQALTNMVRLRSKFRSELRNSKSAVKAIAK